MQEPTQHWKLGKADADGTVRKRTGSSGPAGSSGDGLGSPPRERHIKHCYGSLPRSSEYVPAHILGRTHREVAFPFDS